MYPPGPGSLLKLSKRCCPFSLALATSFRIATRTSGDGTISMRGQTAVTRPTSCLSVVTKIPYVPEGHIAMAASSMGMSEEVSPQTRFGPRATSSPSRPSRNSSPFPLWKVALSSWLSSLRRGITSMSSPVSWTSSPPSGDTSSTMVRTAFRTSSDSCVAMEPVTSCRDSPDCPNLNCRPEPISANLSYGAFEVNSFSRRLRLFISCFWWGSIGAVWYRPSRSRNSRPFEAA
mmetsp:Transcript_106600/g.183791  ORF Transcript_106600/g.183791 Transcript_106600/m.183791 type:complete len:232 (-) Transcript_106600:1279-1974(-)